MRLPWPYAGAPYATRRSGSQPRPEGRGFRLEGACTPPNRSFSNPGLKAGACMAFGHRFAGAGQTRFRLSMSIARTETC